MYKLNDIYGAILDDIASLTEELIDSIALDDQGRESFIKERYTAEYAKNYVLMNEIINPDVSDGELDPDIFPDNFFNEWI